MNKQSSFLELLIQAQSGRTVCRNNKEAYPSYLVVLDYAARSTCHDDTHTLSVAKPRCVHHSLTRTSSVLLMHYPGRQEEEALYAPKDMVATLSSHVRAPATGTLR